MFHSVKIYIAKHNRGSCNVPIINIFANANYFFRKTILGNMEFLVAWCSQVVRKKKPFQFGDLMSLPLAPPSGDLHFYIVCSHTVCEHVHNKLILELCLESFHC